MKIEINPPNFQQVELDITGITPLIQNKMKETTMKEMEDVRTGKAKKSNRKAIDPKKSMLESSYLQDDGSFELPQTPLKKCGVKAPKQNVLKLNNQKTF